MRSRVNDVDLIRSHVFVPFELRYWCVTQIQACLSAPCQTHPEELTNKSVSSLGLHLFYFQFLELFLKHISERKKWVFFSANIVKKKSDSDCVNLTCQKSGPCMNQLQPFKDG